MTIGIRAVSVYSPDDYIDNVLQAEKLDSTKEFITDKIGMLRLARKSNKQETTDLAKLAVEALFCAHSLTSDDVECLILVTQNPDGMGLPHSSAILHHKLNLRTSCVVFDISLGCSGYVQGLSIAQSFMQSNGMSNGVLVTADPYSTIINKNDRDTAMIFGDGSSATWLSNDSPVWDIGPFDFGTDSDQYNALCVEKDMYLHMNGRAVFNFAATRVPESVDRVLNKAKISIIDIDLALLHQGSKFIVETLARRIGLEGKTPFLAENTGNTVSSSIPMLLATKVSNSAKYLLLSGFGVGLSWATCILKKRK